MAGGGRGCSGAGASDEDVKVAMCPEAELGCQWLPVTPNQTQQEGAGGLPEEEHEGSVKGCYHYMLGTVSIPRWALLAAPLGILLVVSALTGMLVKQNGQTRRDRITEYITSLDPPCPHQWMWYEGKCYLFSKETKTWDASQAFCASQNANMSTIGSLQEKAIVTHFKDSKDYWVGLQNKDGEWRWLDGSLLRTDIIQLRNTAPGLDCAYLSSERLGALDCATSRHWICTKDGH
ncbi:C-type lectin domain family 2 member B-like [Pleurodeles waltl]|uniref:C-type lectin domain family 2 member B-like n=1 Tax=Pleurodeles waltl TaxID=8319 RepID=UPI00370954F8